MVLLVKVTGLLEKIVEWCDTRPSFKAYGMLYLAAYAFLLRLPSEALPMRSASPESPDGQSVLRSEGDRVVLTLARRKNRPHQTQLVFQPWRLSMDQYYSMLCWLSDVSCGLVSESSLLSAGSCCKLLVMTALSPTSKAESTAILASQVLPTASVY